ncbi:FAD/FMN-containing dehydrogenase [Rhodobacter sp. JA431]|uniref:FAD-dependent oxidoreductase n=1 Tax=Rhodobacter sp. JA431 TaxID=570013 RepID=UPI000BDD0F2D|nr:FAD-binding protein [Rhodobacter sp. JA431]SOC03615.1 FAD/FMN-containing dehydrogenase [Rhodobacter sp. JA431]
MIHRRDFLLSAACALAAPRLALANAAGPAADTDLTVVPADAPEAEDLALAYAADWLVTPRNRLLCRSEAAVARAVDWASNQPLGFALRSGGHCFAGFSQHPEAVIDTREIVQIEVLDGGHRLRAGPGAQIGDIYRALAPFGRSLPGASYGGVTLGGLVPGGGIGYGARAEGLLIDWLESLRLVTADGKILSASATENPDLFWACRGGGGGRIGVLTEFTFRTAPFAGGHSIDTTVTVPMADIGPIIYLWQLWSAGNPSHVTTHLQLFRLSGGDFLVHLMGRAQGDRAALMEELRLLLRRRTPLPEHAVVSGELVDIVDHMHPPSAGMGAVRFHSRTEILERPLPPETVDAMVALLLAQPEGAVKLVFEALGGAAATPAPDDTSWPHRDAFALLYFSGDIWDEAERAPRARSMTEMQTLLAAHVSGGAYVNYPERGRADYRSAYWGGNAARLAAIKAAHDPNDLFRHPQAW